MNIEIDRAEIAAAAFNGHEGYRLLDAHCLTVMGYAEGGAWHKANSSNLKQIRQVVQGLPDDDLALMLPGGGFDEPLPAGAEPLFVRNGRLFVRLLNGEVAAKTPTGVLRFECFGHSLSRHPQLAEARAHWLALIERGEAQP